MVVPSRTPARSPSYLFPCVISLSVISLAALFLDYKVDDFASKTKTLAGHNLEPTPWHPFPQRTFKEESRRSQAYKIVQCTYLTCLSAMNPIPERRRVASPQKVQTCPDFFKSIHKDLEPWAKSRITMRHIMEAKRFAALRILIIRGKLYVDPYYDCVQTRALFTIWGFLQLLRRYPGLVPDVDIMFDCMDKPVIDKKEHGSFPLPLFRYCTNDAHFDIPFPDWSFWGWSEVNLQPWNEEFKDIKHGSQAKSWKEKLPFAYWKGNPDVLSPLRVELMKCNDSKLWGAEILRQNWAEEAKDGFKKSKLSNQCNHRYKIYAEGYAWSVSLKYILSCNSVALIISQQYKDFFSRGLIPKKNYFPIPSADLCRSIKSVVDWGNANPSEAEKIGKAGQDFMESLTMDRVYDYMLHLITEYSKLLDYKPAPPSSALEACVESLLCLADPKQRQNLEKAAASPSPYPPCTL